jgi:hypothetical protein
MNRAVAGFSRLACLAIMGDHTTTALDSTNILKITVL